MSNIQAIVFSDMDGSLLDHETYSHADADPVLARLDELKIPVIPCTSKTFSELQLIRAELNNHHPFVVENGAAVYIPSDYFDEMPYDAVVREGYLVKEFVNDRQHWQSILQSLKLHLNDAFLTFHQAGVDKIVEMTGLSIEQAQRANDRQYGEPLKWLGTESEYEVFKEYVDQQGGKLLTGGRFIHLSGECDKGQALKWLMGTFANHSVKHAFKSIAVGDSQNDIAMIESADYGILIRSPVHTFPETDKPVYKTKDTGSKGWVEGIKFIFNKLGISLHTKAPL